VFAVIDGLGHGQEATLAAKKAAATIEANPLEPVAALLARCHAALAGTRGAVATLAELDGPGATLTWIGIGDVEGIVHSFRGQKRQSLLLVPGVLGDRIPPNPRVHSVKLEQGDVLVLATDGVRRSFVEEPILLEPMPAAAERIIERHARKTDDALVLLVRYNKTA
jgi:negative regulator of sigma-B (phosphoserine phosphatase)